MTLTYQDKHTILLPYLTPEISPIPCSFKAYPGDFLVEEVPAYTFDGEGEHLFLFVEKKGISTEETRRRLAKQAGCGIGDIGAAGLKDVRSVSRQWLSVYKGETEDFRSFRDQDVEILQITKHRNKLRTGHLTGNLFRVRLRGDSVVERFSEIQDVLTVLIKRGVPNFFGMQRFGMRGDNWKVGKALIEENFTDAAHWIAGNPGEDDDGNFLKARTCFEIGQYREAAQLWPKGFDDCVRLCRAMDREKGNAKRAIHTLGKEKIWFYISSFQSELFNRALAARIQDFDKVFCGDLAFKHENGAVFLVEDDSRENNRAGRFEISPSGPLFGHGMIEAKGAVGVSEFQILESAGIKKENFRDKGILKCLGARRALRTILKDTGAESGRDAYGDFVQIDFFLSKGSFATAVLREIGKTLLREGS